MTTEFDVLPFDASLISDALTQHGVTVAALAMRSGYDDKSIYRYLSGERTLPSTVIRAAFELTHDLRLVALVAGVVPVTLGHPPANRPEAVRIPPVDRLLAETASAIKSAADAMTYIGRVLADSKIDDGDRETVAAFHRHSAAAQRCLSLVDAALRIHIQRVTP